MSSNWPLVQLSELISIKHGFAFKGEFFSDTSTDTVLVTPGNFAIGGGFKAEKLKFYNGPIPVEYKLEADDLIVTMTDLSKQADTLGYSALVPEHSGRLYLHNQRIGLVDIKSQELDKLYLYFLMRSREYRHHVVSSATGSTVKHTSPSKITSFQFHLPPLEIQKNIGRSLKHLEDKAAINHKIKQTLEQMAQAIFKSWFVDFEPVKAKISALEAGGSEEDALLAAMRVIAGDAQGCANAAGGRMPGAAKGDKLTRLQAEQPEQYAELRATAELFPSAMQEIELGEIPEGWNVSQIGDEVTVVGGGTPSTKNPDFWESGEINWTSPKDLSNLADKVLVETERKVTEAGLAKISSGLLPVDTVLMSSRAPVGYLALAKIPVAVNQGYIAMKCEKALSPEFVIQWCAAHMDEIKSRASGTTFAEISKKNFKIIPVVMPSEPLISAYSKQVSSLYNAIENNVRESDSLASLRDTLLPRLLSGELSVTNPETHLAQEAKPANV